MSTHIAFHTTKRLSAARLPVDCHRLIKASLIQSRVTCGKPSCRCAGNARFRHEALNFTYKIKGRSMGLHVPKGMEKEARQAAADYARLKKLVQALSDANIKRFRRKVQAMKSKSHLPARHAQTGKSRN